MSRAPAPSTRCLVALALAGSLWAARTPAQPEDDAAGDLDAAVLERRNATIGDVDIVIDNVFDTSNPEEDKRLYRWANRVHVMTRPSVVQSVLLFESGDPFDPRVLNESARLLRDQSYVAEASIRPVAYDAASNTADVEVRIRDAWALEPDIKLSRSGGENEYGLGLVNDNLLGTGKSLTLSYRSDVDRDQGFVGYEDPNVGGSRVLLDTVLSSASDGHRLSVAGGRPFFAFDTRWSVTGSMLDQDRVDRMYDLGEVVDEFRHETQAFTIGGGVSRGLVNDRALRWLAGFTYDHRDFSPAPGEPDPMLLPEDRKLVYPWAGFQIVEDDFRQVTDLNDMGRTEDVALGLDLRFRLGLARESFGADRDAAIVSASLDKGWEPGGSGRLFLVDVDASARYEDAGTRNSLVTTHARYFHRNLGSHLFSASLSAAVGDELDAERQVLLGGDNGLRGYPLRYQSGERSAVLSLEQRFFTDWYPFRLFRVGYAVFYDTGRVWGDDPRGTAPRGTLSDIGIGLRLSSPRSSGRSVIHIDLAFPLDGDSTIDDMQLTIEKKASF